MESGTQKLAEEVAKLIKFIRISAFMALVGVAGFFLYLWGESLISSKSLKAYPSPPDLSKYKSFKPMENQGKETKKASNFDFMSLPGARLVEEPEKIFKVKRPDGRIWNVPQSNLQKAQELGGEVIGEVPPSLAK